MLWQKSCQLPHLDFQQGQWFILLNAFQVEKMASCVKNEMNWVNKKTNNCPCFIILLFFYWTYSSFPTKKGSFVFLRKVLRWTLIILSQSLSQQERGSDMVGRDGGASALRWMPCKEIHFFFSAFCADLVTFPLEAAFFSTDLMTPTATVCLMSRTAKRPAKGRWTRESVKTAYRWAVSDSHS